MVVQTESQLQTFIGAFSWFAYLDYDGSVARAICPMLGFLVVRPTVSEAVGEMLDVTKDYLAAVGKKDPGTSIARPTPPEAWEDHLVKFIWQLRAVPDGKDHYWDCGMIQ